MARGGLHHRRGARLRRRHPDRDRRRRSRATGRASVGSRATPPTTTSAPSTSWRRCGGRSPSSTARTSSTAAGCGSTPRSTSTCSAPRGTPSPPRSTSPTDPDAALVAVDQYGYVKAMVGGRDFETDEVNLALGAAAGGSGRGAGSSFKPFVLAEAIRQDISLNSKFNAPGVDHVRRRAGRQARRAVEGRATTATPSRACSTSSTPPGCRPTPPTRS